MKYKYSTETEDLVEDKGNLGGIYRQTPWRNSTTAEVTTNTKRVLSGTKLEEVPVTKENLSYVEYKGSRISIAGKSIALLSGAIGYMQRNSVASIEWLDIEGNPVNLTIADFLEIEKLVFDRQERLIKNESRLNRELPTKSKTSLNSINIEEELLRPLRNA